MDKFIKGQMVVPKNKGGFPLMTGQLIVNRVAPGFNIPLYECNDMVGKEYAFWEFELETQYKQDKRLGLLNKIT